MTKIRSARPSVVVVGGGYGGINAATALDDVADVTLVDPTDAFVHNIASWRALVEPEWLERIFFPYEDLLAHGRFLRDRAVGVDGRRVTLASGSVLEPDYVVLATGSAYPFPAKTEEPDIASARARHRAAHEALLAADRALIVGAGPAGLELAGEIKAFFPDKHVTVADSSEDILNGPYPQSLRDELRRQLDALGVELRLGTAITELPSAAPATLAPVAIATADGGELVADIWFRAGAQRVPRGRSAGGPPRRTRLRPRRRVSARRRRDPDLRPRRPRRRRPRHGGHRQRPGRRRRSQHPLAHYRHRGAHQLRDAPTHHRDPLGPEGGAGLLPDGAADAATIAELKGRHMGTGHFAALFDTAPPLAA